MINTIKDRFYGEYLDLREFSAREVLKTAWRINSCNVAVNAVVYQELINTWDNNPEYGGVRIWDCKNDSKYFIELSNAALDKGRLMSA